MPVEDDKISQLPDVPSGTPLKSTDEAIVNFLNLDGSFTTMRDTFAKMKAFFSGDKENTGVAQSLLDAHVGDADPHTQYALDSDLSAYATTNWVFNWAEPKILRSTRTTNYRLDTPNHPSQIIRNGGTSDIGIQTFYTNCKINGAINKTIAVKPNQLAFIKAIQNNDDNYFVFVVDEIPVSSTATTVGIPEPTVDGNNVRTKSGSTLSWSQTELVSTTEKATWNGKQDKPVDQNMSTTGTITLDFNTETFDNITQTGSITFAGTNTIGSKKTVKTLIIQGSGNSAHTFTFPVAWINLSGVLPDFSKQNYIEITYLDGTVFFCVNKYSSVSTTTPTLVTATILQDFLNVIELKYDRLLDGSVALQNSWWSITGKTIIGTQIVNNTVRITVSVAFATTDTAVLSFTNIAGTTDGLQDAVGNKCPNFALQNVVLVRYAFDDFNRADSTTSVGIASDGIAWQVINGTWGISGNKMYAVSAVNSGAATVPIILKTVGLDCSCKYTITWATGTAASPVSTIFRYQDANNYMLLQFGRNGTTKMVTADIYKIIGGTLTQIGSVVNVTSQADGTSNTFIIRVRGYQITMLFNNTVYRSVTDLVLPQGNRVGFRIFDGAGSSGNLDRIDDVVIGE